MASLYSFNNPGYAVCNTSPTLTIFNSSNLGSLLKINDIIDFSSMENITLPIDAYNRSSWLLKFNRICPKQNTKLAETMYISGCISGIILVLSGVSDLLSSIDPIFFGGEILFRKYTIESLKERKGIGKSLEITELDIFLRFAHGEFVDLYHKRGIFNKAKFIASLVKY